MPIYEYRCGSCGLEKEFLQKISDAPIAACPSCGQSTMTKLISAAGFHLKGSGWYATDFKGGSKKPADKSDAASESKPKTEGGESAKSEPAAPAAACGTGCACH
jgi:putative FmdB family regulatory protein